MIAALSNPGHARRKLYVDRGTITWAHREPYVLLTATNSRNNHHDGYRFSPEEARVLAVELNRIADIVDPPAPDNAGRTYPGAPTVPWEPIEGE